MNKDKRKIIQAECVSCDIKLFEDNFECYTRTFDPQGRAIYIPFCKKCFEESE